MKAHERIKISLVSLFIAFSIIGLVVYLIYENANSDLIIFLALLFIGSVGVVVHHIYTIVKDWRIAKAELSEWTKDNPKESVTIGVAAIFASIVILIFYFWPYMASDISPSTPKDIQALVFGIIGSVVFFIVGIVLLRVKDKKDPQ